jgi:DNA repair exonuclease SbcCD ATPase subunit
VRFTSIELEAFRGFAERRRLDLDADVVLIRGDNGSGKTSLIDALLWVLCGSLDYLSDRVKGLRRTEDPIVNRFAGPPARVRLSVLAHGQSWEFERSGTAASCELFAWRDSHPIANAPDSLARVLGEFSASELVAAVQTWGVLRQDALRSALESSGAALHERLAGVLGLERVSLFAENATKTAKDLRRERTRLKRVVDELRRRQSRARERIGELQDQERGPARGERTATNRIRRAIAKLPDGISIRRSDFIEPYELADLIGEISRLLDASKLVAQRQATVSGSEYSSSAAVEELEGQLVDAQGRLEEATQRAPLTVQLAAAALELISDRCPVCGQTIDEASVRSHLNEVLAQSREVAAASAAARDAVNRVQHQLARARADEQSRIDAITRRQQAVDDALALGTASQEIRVDASWLAPTRASELSSALSDALGDLQVLYRDATNALSGVVARAREDEAALAGEVRQAERDYEEIELRYAQGAELDRAAHLAADRILNRALQELEPSFAEVFDRLSPHPAFTELHARQDLYYGRNQIIPEVYDPEKRIAANPMLVFSEGQLNVVALSYFLGLALNAREGALPFVVLDDPLQAMDVIAVLGFADLCRRIRDHRQLLLATHDRRSADLLARKLAPREPGSRTVIHEFEGWTREGPHIRREDVPVDQVVALLRRAAS